MKSPKMAIRATPDQIISFQLKINLIRSINLIYGIIEHQKDRVTSLQVDRVESFGEALLDFTSIADLEAWLSQN